MFTSMVIALSTVFAASSPNAAGFQTDYLAAQQEAQSEHKPLALFVGTGPRGWEQVSREGKLNDRVQQALASNYLSVYLDLGQPEGRTLAEQFGVSEGPALVISDFTGRYQAFAYEGELANANIEHCLRRYANPLRPVVHTESQAALDLSLAVAALDRRETPRWLNDLGAACKLGSRQRKPLAVVIGTGPENWDRVSRDGALSPEANRLLAEHFVCLYVDRDGKEGKALASALEIAGPTGLVLSDHSGKVQAFHRDGALANADLERHLQTYADPERAAQAMEAARRAAVQTSPSSYQPQMQRSFGGRSC